MQILNLLIATLVGLNTITNAHPSSIPSLSPSQLSILLSSPSPTTHHHAPVIPAHIIFKRATKDPSASTIVYFYTQTGKYISQDSANSGDCIPLSVSNWGIAQVSPLSGSNVNSDTDQLDLFDDQNCKTQSRLALPQSSIMVVVKSFFTQAPIGSMRWTRYTNSEPSTSQPSTKSKATGTIPTSTAAQLNTAATTTTLSLSSSPSSSFVPTATASPSSTPSNADFNFTLLPSSPNPRDWGNTCEDGKPHNGSGECGNDDRRSTGNKILIVIIVVTVFAIVIIAIGAYYIYKTFYLAPESNNSSLNGTTAANKGSRSSRFGGGSRTLTRSSSPIGLISSSGSGSGSHSKANSFVYIHDEDESTPPKFMFNHQLDNINTDRNPQKYTGS